MVLEILIKINYSIFCFLLNPKCCQTFLYNKYKMGHFSLSSNKIPSMPFKSTIIILLRSLQLVSASQFQRMTTCFKFLWRQQPTSGTMFFLVIYYCGKKVLQNSGVKTTIYCDFPWFCRSTDLNWLIVFLHFLWSYSKLAAMAGVIWRLHWARHLRWLIHIVSDAISSA